MQRTPAIGHRVKCRNCGQFMKWDSYTLAKRPDSLRQRVRLLTHPEGLHRILPDRTVKLPYIVQLSVYLFGIQSRRHQQQAQIVTQSLLHLQAQSQP